jgi:hypothetical protein
VAFSEHDVSPSRLRLKSAQYLQGFVIPIEMSSPNGERKIYHSTLGNSRESYVAEEDDMYVGIWKHFLEHFFH